MSACTGETMAIVYRRIETIDEYRAVENLQAQVWGSEATIDDCHSFTGTYAHAQARLVIPGMRAERH